MKRALHRLLAVGLAAAIFITTVGASGLGSFLRQNTLELSATAQLTHGQLFNSAVTGGRQTENIVEYRPESGLRPIVAFGTTLYGRSTLNYVASYLAGAGKTVVAGVNASFFDLSTGVPYGCVMTGGVIRSSGDIQTVGFRDDGTALIGKPGLTLNITYPNGSSSVLLYNKTLRRDNGAILYSRDFDTKTKNTISAYNVVLQPDTAELRPGQTMTAKVLSVAADTASCDIPAGCMVLSMATDTAYAYTFSTQIGTLKAGDTVTVSTAISDAWKDVTYAVGGDELLVENGAANTSFRLDSANRRVARTAVGLKQDGTLVLYTMDGLQSGYSTGVTLSELAARMAELGCVTALNLDGGGSTSLSAQYPGDSSLTGVNKPSDGSQRKCANFIFLVRDTTAPGEAANLHLYPYDAAVLSGASLQLTVKATDANYMAAALPADLTYTATGGAVSETGLFTAGAADGNAAVQVTSGSGAAGTRVIRVAANPSTVTVKNQSTGAAVAALSVAAGKSVDLTAASTLYGYDLVSQDACYRWAVSGNIGTVDANGKFTAADVTTAAAGTITCTAGSVQTTVSVHVTPMQPEGAAIHGFEADQSAAVSGAGLAVAQNRDLNYVRYGASSLRASYDLTKSAVTGGKRQVTAGLDAALPEHTDTVGLWVCGDNSGNSLSLLFKSGETQASKWLTQLNFTGWKYVTAAIPSGAAAVTGFAITESDAASARTGTVYLDQLIAAHGALNDTTPPAIAAAQSGASLKITASDGGSGLGAVAVTLDGATQSAAFSGGVGTLTLPADGQAHQVRIAASDNCGNLSSKTVSISGALSDPFPDMDDHWAASYVNYCSREGILNGSAVDGVLRFRPDDSMTRQEFAAALIRFLGVNTADYAATSLPFADSGKIAPWAQDAMRAAYALGLITGSTSNGKLYANPTATVTRQEAMAILGRTQQKGFAEDSLSAFSDAASVPAWARSHIASMVSRGVIAGSGGRLNPGGTVTRGQVAKMLYNLY